MIRFLALAVAMCWLTSAETLYAQRAGRNSTGGGGFGGSSFGGGGSFGNSSFGSGRSTSSFGSSGGFRPNNSGFGSGQTGSMTGAAGDPFAAARTAQRSIGRDGAGGINTGGRNTRNTRTRQRPQTNFGGANALTQNNQNFSQRNNQQLLRLRPVIRIAFPTLAVSRAEVAQTIATSLSPQSVPSARNIRVTMNAGVAVLTGAVANSHDARLAAALASLEPGVRSVRNELVIAAAGEPAAPDTSNP